VSVIIPNYNYGRYLKECIDSVLVQTYPNVEVIVIDDGSTDDSLSILKNYGNRILVIEQANQGVSAARNRGIEEAKGELFAFLDADDAWDADKLNLQGAVLQDKNIGMVYTGLQFISEDSKETGQSLRGASGDVLEAMARMEPPGMPATGSSCLLLRKCLQDVGGFDQRLSTSADWDLWARIAAKYQVEFISKPLTRYRLHGNGMHLNVRVLEKDNLLTLSKIFADPAASRVYRWKRRSYGKLFSILSGSHLGAGNYGRAFYFAFKSFLYWPPNVLYALALPVRRLSRWVNGAGVTPSSVKDV
jgi:glycosyltransferase involved in cell wall biosynthesis